MQQRFRAYNNLDEGATDYVKFMSRRYGTALAAAERGDVRGFASQLKQHRYYTAPVKQYAYGLEMLVKHGPLPLPKGTPQVRPGDAVVPLADTAPRAGDDAREDAVRQLSLPTLALVRAIHDTAVRASMLASPDEETGGGATK